MTLIDEVRLALGRFGIRGRLVAAGAGFATPLMVGIVTAIVENSLFVRRSRTYAPC